MRGHLLCVFEQPFIALSAVEQTPRLQIDGT
jgi:hypothetical protein